MVLLKQLFISLLIIYSTSLIYLFIKTKNENNGTVLKNGITVGIVDFEFDADLKLHQLESTIESVCKYLPKSQIIVFSETPIYPPLRFSTADSIPCQVTVRIEQNNELTGYIDNQIQNFIHFDNIFLIPDKLHLKEGIEEYLWSLLPLQRKQVQVVASDVNAKCSSIHLSRVKWRLEFSNRTECDHSFSDSNSFLMRSETFVTLSYPLLRPLSQSIFLQGKSKHLQFKMHYATEYLNYSSGSSGLEVSSRLSYIQSKRMSDMYEQLGIKEIIESNGSSRLLGCKREETRCFPSIVDDMPSYLHQGKWTPPCCLEHLRETARHVIRVLEAYKIRYWLEGGSLLGALRNGDIIPWDSDVDIGVYQEDLKKLFIFQDARRKGPVMDELGYVWEASEQSTSTVSTNNYLYRVHYSPSNRVHVDIFPFYPLNGSMTKDYWFPTHRQDVPFPESFLKPMSKVTFLGLQVAVPADPLHFIDFKFGSHALTTYKLPNGTLINALHTDHQH